MEGRERWMRWGDEMGIKVILGLLNDGRGHCTQARREKDLDKCVTWKHDGKLVYMKKNWTRLMRLRSVCRLFRYLQIVFKSTHKKNASMDLYSPWTPVTCHHFLFWNLTLPLIFVPVSVRLVFIADRHQGDRSTHGGLFNYTLFLHVSVNNPTDTIIHVAISINTVKRSAVKLWVMWLRLGVSFMTSLLRSFYCLEFNSHLLSICWLNGPFIGLYVATALCVGGWFTNISSFGKKVKLLRFFMNERLFLIQLKMAENIMCSHNNRLYSISWHIDNNMLFSELLFTLSYIQIWILKHASCFWFFGFTDG